MKASLSTLVRRSLAGETKLPRGTTILVATSGGPDSIALLHALARAAPGAGLTIVAHGVDHGLRVDASQELDRAAELATFLGIPFARTRVGVARGGNIQARARAARWTALADAAKAARAAAIATGHHCDDRAETVLIRLLRGAGAEGLAVMPARAPVPGVPDVEIVRPLLRARRADVLLHIERHALPVSTDPSNADPRFVRTRVRREVLPLLEQLDPAIAFHLAALADELGRETRPSSAPWSLDLPRQTREAIDRLARERKGRVWLPGGLVVTVDPRAGVPSSLKSGKAVHRARPAKSRV
jgi:tRNA(Ile)-lysidine synthase